MKKVAIIGGGAAGFFTAINLAERRKDLDIHIYEGQNKLLSKVLISGGGRCNVTNAVTAPKKLSMHYPRGQKELVKVFERFGSKETQAWFSERGVALKTEADGRVFPVSNSSQTIYDCLVDSARSLGIHIHLGHRLRTAYRQDGQWQLNFTAGEQLADTLVICTGSNNAIWQILEGMGHRMASPTPSLFTFIVKDPALNALSGLSHTVGLTIGEIKTEGPLLITHKGLSGPAILKASAWGAYKLAEKHYHFTAEINWLHQSSAHELQSGFRARILDTPKEKVAQWQDHNLPKRLWSLLLERAEIKPYTNWSEVGKKGIQRLLKQLTGFEVQVTGKNTFKEEFVTAGGVVLEEMDLKQFKSKKVDGLYMAGEVLNIDALTGGFNFQAAWSGAYLISQSI